MSEDHGGDLFAEPVYESREIRFGDGGPSDVGESTEHVDLFADSNQASPSDASADAGETVGDTARDMEAAGVSHAASSRASANRPATPKGRAEFYLLKNGRIVEGLKNAGKHKTVIAMTWEGADRWWRVEPTEAKVNAKENPETSQATRTPTNAK